MRRNIYAALAALLVCGCAAQQQKQLQAECQQQFASARAQMRSAVEGNPRIDPIRDKINLLDPRNATLAQLSLNTVPSETEKKALEEWQGTVQAHIPTLNAAFQRCSPWQTPVFDMARAAAMSNLVDLHTGKITFGEYNRRRMEVTARFAQALQDREQELQRQQMQAASVAAQQSIATSAATSTFQNYLIGQQLINQQMQPARIAPFTCTRFGNTTNCY